MVTVRKTFSFHAAHCIPHHDGHCARPHGHTYTVTIEAAGPVATDGPGRGMVIDFGRIKDLYAEVIHDVCDHRDLNEAFLFDTTAENLALHFLSELHAREPMIFAVEVSEGPNNTARAALDVAREKLVAEINDWMESVVDALEVWQRDIGRLVRRLAR